MTFDELKNGMKSLFSSLGAKTSDSNYAVGLFDKTSAEPKGIMDMASLASVLGGQYTHAWHDGVFVRYLWNWQSVGGNPIKMTGLGVCLLVAYHVNGFRCAYFVYQTGLSDFPNNTGYHEVFKNGTTTEFNMYMNTADHSFYFKGNGGGIMIGIIPICGDLGLQQVSADLSQMTKIF